MNDSSLTLPVVIGRLMRCALFLGLAGCAGTSPQRFASREYFPESIYGRASPRVVADDRPIPHGGGQFLVGHPYTIAGKTYYPTTKPRTTQFGIASYYGSAFRGRRTANGEIYDTSSISAANPTMPLPSYARVTDLANHRSIIVRVNDRGPYAAGRIMDVSERAAQLLGFINHGTAPVRVDYLGPASLGGSDNAMLLASLRTDGSPAEFGGQNGAPPTMLANATSSPAAHGRASAPFAGAELAELIAHSEAGVSAIPTHATARMPRHAPLPPVRPFDLGNAAPFSARRQHQAEAVLYTGPVPGLVRISAGNIVSEASLVR